MSMQWIRDYYKVPARIGGRVTYLGQPGQIVCAAGQYLRIRLDGEKRSRIFHPVWEIAYLPEPAPSKPAPGASMRAKLRHNLPGCNRNGLTAGRVVIVSCELYRNGVKKYWTLDDHGRQVKINLRDIEGVASVG